MERKEDLSIPSADDKKFSMSFDCFDTPAGLNGGDQTTAECISEDGGVRFRNFGVCRAPSATVK